MVQSGKKSQLKIAVLSETFARGGAERQGYFLAIELGKLGHRVTVLSLAVPSKKFSASAGLSGEFSEVAVQHIFPISLGLARSAYRILAKTFARRSQNRLAENATKSSDRKHMNRKPSLTRFLLAKLFLGGGQEQVSRLLARLMGFHLPSGLEVRFLSRFLQRENYDLLISFLPGNNAISILASLASDTPVIVSERNDFLRQPASQKDRWARSALYPLADMITANTEFGVEQLNNSFPEKNIVWLPNSIRPTHRGKCLKVESNNIYVISRLEPHKHIEKIIEALPHLRNLGFFPRVVIFGEGTQEAMLRGLASELGLARQVIFRGYVPAREIYQNEVCSGFFVSNSSYEGSSNSLHEAVAAGLIPVLSQTVEEIQSIVRPDLLRHILTDGSAESLADTLRKIFQDSDFRSDIHSAILEDFTHHWKRREKCLEEALSIFVQLARTPKPRHSC